MTKSIDLRDSVYSICREYPEVRDILKELDFSDIAKPGALKTVGKLMTIPRGASLRDISLSEVITKLENAGFEIADPAFSRNLSAEAGQNPSETQKNSTVSGQEQRISLLKDYVARLSRGDSLDDVRRDFVANFRTVDAAEIAGAEQDLILGGTPVEEVQRLCDVHSALFHGATREEQIANAEEAVQASAARMDQDHARNPLLAIPGHPVNVLTAENALISELLSSFREALSSGIAESAAADRLKSLHVISMHYAEKGDLLYPLLKSRYGVTGPADVMWGVDDEIREELRILSGSGAALPHFRERLDQLLTRAEEMVYKENNILFPLCMEHFTEQDWMSIYHELKSCQPVLPGGYPAWDSAESWHAAQASATDGRTPSGESGEDSIPLGVGHMTRAQIEAVLNTIPMELSFIDDHNINRYFNGGKKLFKRPAAAIDREVFDCHPPKYAAMARQIIDELRSGGQSSVDVWMAKSGEPVLVRYMAVRNEDGSYAGTLECVQRMNLAKRHFCDQAS